MMRARIHLHSFPLSMSSSAVLWNLFVAAAVGLAVGVERERSGQRSGSHAHFAGVRTFFLLGILGGLAGWLLDDGAVSAGAVLLGSGAALVLVAYAASARRDSVDAIDGTTEVAAIVVLALGALAGLGQTAIAGGIAAVTVLALGEKERLHWLVRRVGAEELRAASQFAVLALVVLPLLPDREIGPYGGISPRGLWIIVLLISGLNFAGYLARRAVGATRGYGVAGALGGLVSSTAVTLGFSRQSRTEEQHARALGAGIVAACSIPFARVLAIGGAIEPSIVSPLLPWVLPPLAVGAVLTILALRRNEETGEAANDGIEVRSPLRLGSALQMAILFQLALVAMRFVQQRWGSLGVVGTAAVLGLTDVDAVTLSMARLSADEAQAVLAARAIAAALAVNTLVKLGIVLTIGAPALRRRAAPGLALLVAACGAGWYLAAR
jgi:uncharacterized membrane protein (DUF4010 family)